MLCAPAAAAKTLVRKALQSIVWRLMECACIRPINSSRYARARSDGAPEGSVGALLPPQPAAPMVASKTSHPADLALLLTRPSIDSLCPTIMEHMRRILPVVLIGLVTLAPIVAAAQPLPDRVAGLTKGFKGTVVLYAKNLSTGREFGVAPDTRV